MTLSSFFIVRCGQMRTLGEFAGLAGQDHPRGQRVVVRTERGHELGDVLCPATDRTTLYLENPPRGEMLRVATEEDLATADRLATQQAAGYDACRDLIAQRRLQMNLVDVEAILGGERLIFYYLADKRVDFRELVKDLARTFHTRIEMRQIGIRDEAKLLADYGDCGKPVCCNTHLTRMPPVSMRMAKIQKTTLDPTKISGRCGRLKCCLRYEYDTYRALEQELPPIGSRVATDRGVGKVIGLEVLAGKVVVEFDDRRRASIPADEILGVEKKGRPRSDDQHEPEHDDHVEDRP